MHCSTCFLIAQRPKAPIPAGHNHPLPPLCHRPVQMMDRMLGTDFDITAGTPPTPFSRAAQLGLPTAGSLPQAPPSVASKPELELASLPQRCAFAAVKLDTLVGGFRAYQ